MQLKDFLRVIQRRWWLALLVAVAAASAAFLYSLAQPKIYESVVKVVGKPARPDEGLNNFIKSELRRLPATLSSTNAAAQIDARGHFDLGPNAILDKIKVQPKPDEAILIITVNDTDGKRAARLADAAADYVQEENLKAVATVPDDSKIFFEKASRASVPDRPSQPRTLLNTAAAGGLGLILGLIFIFVVEFFDNSLRSEEEVESITGLQVLGTIPPWRPTSTGPVPASARRLPSSPNPTASADASDDLPGKKLQEEKLDSKDNTNIR